VGWQIVYFRVGESRMNVNHGTEGQLPGQLKYAGTDQPVGNIRFQVRVDIGTDDRLLEGYEDVRQGIEIPPGLAPNVGDSQFAAAARSIADRRFQLSIVRAARSR